MRLLAYIDLPSGSAIFQFLIAGLLGLSVAFRSFWRRIWDALTGRSRRQASSEARSSGARDGGTAATGDGTAATAERSQRPVRKG